MKKVLKSIIIMSIFVFAKNVFAMDVDSITTCNYSKAFKQWNQMTNDEKAKENMPSICEQTSKQSIINSITSSSLNLKESNIPSTYNAATYGFVTSVKNQESTGSCWTFSATSNLESYMLKKHSKKYDFSERHMEYATSRTFTDGTNINGFNREVDDGGNYFISSSYYMNHTGPVLESTVPFQNTTQKTTLNEIQNKKVELDVNDYMHLENSSSCNNVSNIIKQEIMENGSVGSTINMNSSTTYLNKKTYAYNYTGEDNSNHAITIVGWDDNYSVNNFASTSRPSSNGAWIVKNSYGASWGNSGYFYVSYEDTNICSSLGAVTDADQEFDDHTYTYDKYGYNIAIGFGSSTTAYAAATFSKGENVEELTEVTVGSLHYSHIDIYVIPDSRTLKISNATLVGSGDISNGGYKTIKLDNPVLLSDNKYSVIVKYTTTQEYPVTVSGSVEGTSWEYVNPNANETFISSSGNTFYDLSTILEDTPCVASIKASTNDVVVKINDETNKEYNIYNNKESIANIKLTTEYIKDNATINSVIKNSEGVISDDFNLILSQVNNNHATIELSAKNTALIGTYKIELSYLNGSLDIPFSVSYYNYVEEIKINDVNEYDNREIDFNPIVLPESAENKELKITSSNENIATYKDGKIQTKQIGTCTITIESTDGSNISKVINVNVTDGLLSNKLYTFEETKVSDIKTNTTITKLKSNIEDNIKIYNQNNEEVTSGLVGTGYKVVKTYSDNTTKSFDVIIKGDLSGDGRLNISDVNDLYEHYIGKKKITNELFKEAADITEDNKISIADFNKIYDYYTGKSNTLS